MEEVASSGARQLRDGRQPWRAVLSGRERMTQPAARKPNSRITTGNSGGGGIRTLGPATAGQRFSRPPHSTALPPLRAGPRDAPRAARYDTAPRGEVAEWLKAAAC